MESSKRHVGRPKASPQTGPLVLTERRARTKIEIEIGVEAAQELADYVGWVEVSEGMSTTDAQAMTVEFALRSVFKRDRLWQERRRSDEAPAPSRRPASAPEAPTAPSSRPPSVPRPLPGPGPRGASDRVPIPTPEKAQ